MPGVKSKFKASFNCTRTSTAHTVRRPVRARQLRNKFLRFWQPQVNGVVWTKKWPWPHGMNQLWYIWARQAGATISVITAFDLPYFLEVSYLLPFIGTSLFIYLVRDVPRIYHVVVNRLDWTNKLPKLQITTSDWRKVRSYGFLSVIKKNCFYCLTYKE